MTGSEPATVLVVDDEAEVADAYAEQLDDRFDVRTVYSGRGALDALEPDVDVVLLDRRMPEVSGDDVLEEIRARELATRVAMVTAVDPDYDIIDMPFDDYVVKPVSRPALVDTIERLLTCAAYQSAVREYYSLSSKYAALQATKTAAELDRNEEFQELESEMQQLRGRLDDLVSSFDEADYEVVMQDFDRPDVGSTDVR